MSDDDDGDGGPVVALDYFLASSRSLPPGMQ